MADVDAKNVPDSSAAMAGASTSTHAYREQAREALAKARKHLAIGDVDSAILGCLFMRMSVEALAYDLLLAYRAEAPFKAMQSWQPQRVISELLTIDDSVERGSDLIEFRDADGTLILSGKETRFEAKWAQSAHSALSSFLHVPTIKRAENGKRASVGDMRTKADEIGKTLDEVLASGIYNFNVGQFVEIRCTCGFDIKRKMPSLQETGELKCGECGRRWAYSRDDENQRFKFEQPNGVFSCTKCGEKVVVTRYDIEKELRVRCGCGAEYQMTPAYSFTLCEAAAEVGTSRGGRQYEAKKAPSGALIG